MREKFLPNLQIAQSLGRRRLWQFLLLTTAVMMIAAVAEHRMGRRWFCACGVIRFWAGDVNGPENSQQIADWYSFSHIIHGFLFFGLWALLRRGVPRWRSFSIGFWLLLTVCIETGWELLENSPFIIARYRKTMSEQYAGDSILNSMSDISFAILGFTLARWLPAWLTIVLAIAMELFVGFWIRDNLTLNVIMLIHPFQGIRRWQTGH